MPCDTNRLPQETPEQRRAAIDAALRKLEQRIKAGAVELRVGANGAIALANWSAEDRNRVTDVCAFRALYRQRSWPLLRALERAELQAGRKVNLLSVASGVHSHDGGQTWHAGH